MQESRIGKGEKTIRDDSTALAKRHRGLTNSKSAGVLRGFLEAMEPVVSFIYRSGINVLYKNASLDGAEGFFFPSGGLCWGGAEAGGKGRRGIGRRVLRQRQDTRRNAGSP
jgi:hypothetical protein